MVHPQHEPPKDRIDWRLRTVEWIKENPKAYGFFKKFALQMAARRQRFGINLLRERVRWECKYEYGENDYKFCNTMSPYISRALISEFPELDGLIVCRETKW
jgi:hypothetical protein